MHGLHGRESTYRCIPCVIYVLERVMVVGLGNGKLREIRVDATGAAVKGRQRLHSYFIVKYH